MNLVLVRHGETDWVREHRYQGSTDVLLNRNGRNQAKALARYLKKYKPAAVYSSQLTRAKETAKLIASACGKRFQLDSRLNEVSFGEWEGMFHRAILKCSPKKARAWYRGSWSSRPPGGESIQSLGRRVSFFLRDLVKKYEKTDETCV